MLPVITVDNFSGWTKIVANLFKQDDLNEYITIFTEKYLRSIVGAGAYQDIESQTRQKWDDLINGVNYVDSEGKRSYHNGLFTPLVYFIYWEFIRDNFVATQPGNTKPKYENSERSMSLEVAEIARARYNYAVYLTCTTEDFLESNNEFIEEITNTVDNLDNTYTLSISSTKYLENDDFVTIDDIDYQVSNVVENVSIDIDGGSTGLNFTGKNSLWQPFKDVDYTQIETSVI